MFKPTIKEKGDYILFYGRLSFEKGIPTLLKAAARHPEINVNVVGTGPLEGELKRDYEIALSAGASQKKCYENIKFLGYHSGGELFELVRNAKFVCVPSEWYENNPMTIVESYSLGTPVIGSNIGGIPEIVEDGKTGWLFEPGDVNGLEKVMLKAASIKKGEYEKMCAAAYAFYKKNFNEVVYYQRLMDFYDEIINKR